MTTRSGEPPDLLAEAVEAYRRRFGTAPGTWEHMHDLPSLIREILAAVSRGKPLADAELHRRLGTKPAPPGAIL
jgi:hypothetical protein